MEITFPVEFVVRGTPVSQQATIRASIARWKTKVREACAPKLPEGHGATDARVSVTLYYLPSEPMEGDLDNIVKPILDTLTQYVIMDDHQVDRLLVQRFDPDTIAELVDPSEVLRQAWAGERLVLYVRVSDLIGAQVS